MPLKTILPKAIASVQEAKTLLKQLHDNGEAYHPEDRAADCLRYKGITAEQAAQLDKLMNDIYGLPGNENYPHLVFDPCDYLNQLAGHEM